VRRWKGILSVFCLAIWLPATQHCRLENLPGFGVLRCASETEGGTDADCQGDSCNSVERGVYKAPDNADLAGKVLFAVMVLPRFDSSSIERPVSGKTSDFFPPSDETLLAPDNWQFYSALAVPIRGPSLPS